MYVSIANPVQPWAREALAHVRQRVGSDGEFVRFDNRAPQWVHDMAQDVHESQGWWVPDDYIYRFIQQSLEAIAKADPFDALEAIADRLEGDEHVAALAGWLGSDPRRVAYADDAIAQQEYSDFSVVDLLAAGQKAEIRAVFECVTRFLFDRLPSAEHEEVN